MYSLNCYHGTYATKSIIENGFWSSDSGKDWLGDGVYFFQSIDEDSNLGKKNAKKWVYKKWVHSDKTIKRYGIIKSIVEVDDEYLLDLTIPSQFEYFHIIRQEYLAEQMRKKIEVRFPRDGVELDSLIIKRICSKTRIDVARKFDYIKYPCDVRMGVNSRIPNCLMVCVKNKEECIKTLEIEEEGDIDVGSKEYL